MLRLHLLPTHLRQLIQARLAHTSSSSPFPFPQHPRPTPHQIFHLRPGASQSDIKARYYDLVRSHHPDSPFCRGLPPEIVHHRFQCIASAYDALRGKSKPIAPFQWADDSMQVEINRRRAYSAHRSRRAEWSYEYEKQKQKQWERNPDERWKDRIIIGLGLTCLIWGLFPFAPLSPFVYASNERPWDKHHKLAAANLAQARKEASEYGVERNREVRKRVQAYRAEQELLEGKKREEES